MLLYSEIYLYGQYFASFFAFFLAGISAFSLVLRLLIMINCLKKWKSSCCKSQNHILKDVAATCFTQAGGKGLIWGHFSVSVLFLTDFALVMISLKLFDRQWKSSCWNPGIFHHNWTCIPLNITLRVLRSQPVTAPVTAAACSLFHEKRRLKTSSFQGKSFNSHFSSCSLRLKTRPSPFLRAGECTGDG